MGDDFGVSVAVKGNALGLQLAFEGGVILDDAVVYDGDGPVGAEMGMSVAVVGRTMSGPARMADAVAAGGRVIAQELGGVGHAARALAQRHMRSSPGCG